MEPILKNPLFSSILRTWKFFTTFHQYLDLPNTFSQLSLYEFYQHITHNQFTPFTAQLVQALVKKIRSPEKNKKNSTTAFFLAKQNKFQFFEELIQISPYELGLTEVTFALAWRNLDILSTQKPFEELTDKQKFVYLSLLTDLVSTNEAFKKSYMEVLKTEYATAMEADKQKSLEIQKKFVSRINYSSILGKDSKGNSYFYLSKIGDSILKYELDTKIWKRIEGHENISKQILEEIIESPNSIGNNEVDLLEQISEIWNRIGWDIKYNAFDRDHKIFNINQEAPKPNKKKIITEKLHQLDYQYSKFINDCFNFRWAPKQRRIAYHKEIDQAATIQDLVGCFSKFYHQTRHSVQKKLNTLDFYDQSLQTDDKNPEQFKAIFLHTNYLYSKGAVSEAPNSQKYPIGLYYHIKNFLQNSNKHLLFEYLFIFVQSMLGIIKDLYPGLQRKRMKQIQVLQREAKQKKLLLKESKQQKTSKLRKKNQRISTQKKSGDDSPASSEQETSSESETTQSKRRQSRAPQRRLREKVKVNYKISINSNSNKVQKKSSKAIIKDRKQLGRNGKGSKKSKMTLDSDSENDYEDEMNLSVSDDGQKVSKRSGINLDNYKYEEDSPKVSVRRSMRTSSKSKEKK